MNDFTEALSDSPDPEGVKRVLAHADEDAKALFAELRGCNKKIVLVDIARDDPAFPLLEKRLQNMRMFRAGFGQVAPLDVTGEAYMRDIANAAASNKARDEVMERQLRSLFEQANQMDDPPSVSIMVGAVHHSALAPFGIDQQRAIALEQELLETHAIAELREGNTQRAQELADRSLLSKYMRVGVSFNTKQTDKLVRQFTPARVRDALVGLQIVLADKYEDASIKAEKIRAVVGITMQGYIADSGDEGVAFLRSLAERQR